MTFMHMSLLAGGLACVAIPILIHLLMNRRRKPVRWGAMRFLREAYRRQRKRLLVERWLLLAVRCLMLAVLAVALGRPIVGALGGADVARARTVYLLVDNSITSAVTASDDDGSNDAPIAGADGASRAAVGSGDGVVGGRGVGGRRAIDSFTSLAKQLLSSLGRGLGTSIQTGSGQRVALIAMGGPAEAVVLPASTDLDGVSRQLDALRPTDSRADLAGAVALIAQDLANAPRETETAPPIVIVLSDHLAGTIDASRVNAGEAAFDAGSSLANGAGADVGGSTGASSVSTVGASSAAAVDGAPALGSLPKGTTMLVLSPRELSADNVSITGVQPLRRVLVNSGADGGGSEQVVVALARSGPGVAAAATTRVRLDVVSAANLGTNASAGSDADSQGRRPVGAPLDAPAGTVRWSPGQTSASVTIAIDRAFLDARTGSLTGLSSVDSGGVQNDPTTGASREGLGALVARIDGDALDRDDVATGPIERRASIRVGILAPRRIETLARADSLDAASWLRLALQASGDGRERLDGARGSSGIDVVQIDPSAVETARLSALDAVFVTRPDLVNAAGWQRLRLFVDSGGLLALSPSSENPVQTWSDTATRALGLAWTCEREARAVASTSPSPTGGPSARPDASAPPAWPTLRPAQRGSRGASRDAATNGSGGGARASEVGRTSDGEGARSPRTNERSAGGGADAASGLSREEQAGRVAHANETGAAILGLIAGELADLARGVRVERVLAMQTDAQDRDAVARGTLLELDDGTPILWAGRPTKAAQTNNGTGGLVVYLATAIDLAWTDLPAKPLMVPLVQELARQGVGASRLGEVAVAGRAVTLPTGTTELVPIAADALMSSVDDAGASPSGASRGSMGNAAGTPEPRRVAVQPDSGATREALRHAGVWNAVDDRGQTRALVNVNPDAEGGRMVPQSRTAVAAIWAGAIERASGSGEVSGRDAERAVVWLARTDIQGESGVGSSGERAGGSNSGTSDGGTRTLDATSVTADELSTVLRGHASQDSPWSMPLLWMLLGLGLIEMVVARLASHASATGSPSFIALAWSRLTQATVGTDAAAILPSPASASRGAGSSPSERGSDRSREGAAA